MLTQHSIRRFRAIVKRLDIGEFTDEQNKAVKLWLLSGFICSLIGCLFVIKHSWASDYSFMIGLYPVVFYYFSIRFLMWEKEDLK